tara:strand:- start:283 stop:1128 length:846 start_codon:yes stop_codon:yes gene_type:complete
MEVVEDTGEWLGVDTSGCQPKLSEVPYSGIGHNSEAAIIGRIKYTIDSLIKLGEEHEGALQVLVDNQEEERETILLVLGRQLLSGRKPFEGENGKLKNQRGYGKWISRNFTDLREIVSKDEQSAILWAAEFPEQHQEMLDKHPRVRTTRGSYAKWNKEDGVGSGGDKPNEPKDKKPWNTDNPDKTRAKAKLSTVASSIFGVLTNVQLFEETNGVDINAEELTRAIMSEINIQGERPESEIQEQINGLKYVLSLLEKSLPVISGEGTNVINLRKKTHKGNKS